MDGQPYTILCGSRQAGKPMLYPKQVWLLLELIMGQRAQVQVARHSPDWGRVAQGRGLGSGLMDRSWLLIPPWVILLTGPTSTLPHPPTPPTFPLPPKSPMLDKLSRPVGSLPAAICSVAGPARVLAPTQHVLGWNKSPLQHVCDSTGWCKQLALAQGNYRNTP